MKKGFARYYTPLCFWAWTVFQRPSSLSLVFAAPPPYTPTPPHGTGNIERKPRLEEDHDRGERERTPEGRFICFLGILYTKHQSRSRGLKSI